MRINKFARSLLQTSAIVAVSVTNAYAQDAEVEEQPVPESDVVMVTGSRIKSDTFTSPVAIDVLTVEEAKIDGISDIAGLLQTATAASGSSQITASTSAAFVQNGGIGTETVALRGLNANRTLTLINGRRAGPSGTRGAIDAFDLNSLPLAGIERVDILKDGASSVYGSDAIAGVVNYITNKSDGATVDVFSEVPTNGGGETFRASGSYGKTFDKGRFRATADYFKRKELARGDRDYLNCQENYAFNADGSRADIIDPRTGEPNCNDLLWGHIWVYSSSAGGPNGTNVLSGPRRLVQFDYDGALAANGLPSYADVNANDGVQLSTPANWFPVYYRQSDIDNVVAANIANGLPPSVWTGIDVGNNALGLTNLDHPFQDEETLSPEVDRYTFMFEGDYELTDAVTAYGEALFSRRTTKVNGYRQFWSYHYGENSFVPGISQLPTAAGWGGSHWFSPTAITDQNDQETTVDYMRFVGGLKGDFNDDGPFPGWSWDIYAQHSDSSGEYKDQQVNSDSVSPYDFTTTSCQNLDFGNGLGMTPGASNADGTITFAPRPCVDVPWFDPEFLAGNISQEVSDFLFIDSVGQTDFTQTTIEGFVSGDVISVPAGKISAALGVFYQRDEIDDTPSDEIQAGIAYLTSTADPTRGSQKTNAIYGEVQIPFVRDKMLFENLTATLSGRFTEITTTRTTGESIATDGFNYRASLDWQVVPSIRFRGTKGTSFRAPGLFEQFLGGQTSFIAPTRIDPCIDWANAVAAGSISQTTANNCQSEGIPGNRVDFDGGVITTEISQGGGFGVLKPETSENYTVGAVFTPSFADLSIAVDYFDIEINDEIDTLSAAQILNGCYTSENFATEPLCNFLVREPAGGADPFRIDSVTATFINVNSQVNNGIDLTIRYGLDTKWGRFDLNSQITHQLESKGLLLADDTVEDFNGELGEPKTTGFANLTFKPGNDWSFRWGVDYVGQTSNEKRFARNNPNPTLFNVPVTFKQNTESVFYHAASVEYILNGGWEFRAGVNNIFDEHPPAYSNSSTLAGNSPLVSNYDFLGRRAFVNITKTFD